MSYTISKTFEFSASHQLRGLREGHQCARLHGHNYRLRVELTATVLDQHGFVYDYGDLAPFKAWVDGTLDHRHLNDLLPFSQGIQPTAEMLSWWLHGQVRLHCDLPHDVAAVVWVSETPKTWAVWRP